MTASEMFPVMVWRDSKAYVPWSLVAPHEPQALRNHTQTLKRLAERGGLCPRELACVLTGKRWSQSPQTEKEAWSIIWEIAKHQPKEGS